MDFTTHLEIVVTGESEDVGAVFLAVDQARADEVLRVLAQRRLRREIHFRRVYDSFVLQNLLLALVVAEGLKMIVSFDILP